MAFREGGWIILLMVLTLGLDLFTCGLRTGAESPAVRSAEPVSDTKLEVI